MPLFTSPREKRYWLFAALVAAAIFATLLMGRPLQHMLRDQNVQAIFFLTGMVLTAVAILIHGWRVRPHRSELAIWTGLAAVYTMFVFRLGAPERSHLIEYSVLAIFIHRALVERMGTERSVWRPALLAFAITLGVALLDEGLQFFLPHRVFDPVDLFFDGMVAFMALAASLVLEWARRRFRK